MNKFQRYDYLDVLRTIAIMLVVFIHSFDQMAEVYNFDSRSYAFFMHGILRTIGRVGVPLFFMVSGALLISRPIDALTFYRKRIPRLALAIFFVSILYEFFCVKILALPPTHSLLIGILSGRTGYAYHLWFLYTTIGIYLAAPFIQKFLDNSSDKLIAGYLLISCLIGFVPRLAAPFLSGLVIPSVMMDFFNPYISYFIMGYFFHNRLRHVPSKSILLIILGICLITPAIILQYIDLPGDDFIQKSDSILWHDKLFVFVMAPCVFLITKYWCLEHEIKQKYMNGIKIIASSSFTIYLMHLLIIFTFKTNNRMVESFGFVTSSLFLMIVCVILCCPINRLLKCVPYLRRVFC